MTIEPMIVTHEIVINAPPEAVWRFVASVEGMKAWLGPREFDPRPGGRIVFRTHHNDQDLHIWGEIVTFDPPRELAFTWTEQVIGAEPWPVATLVRVRLTPERGGTRVSLNHSGFEKLPREMAQREFRGYTQGWAVLHDLDKLKAMVEEAA